MRPTKLRTDAADAVALPTGTVTLLMADVEGSTGRWDSAPHDMVHSFARHDELVFRLVDQHAGMRPVEQGEGDSFVAAFARASDAVACAADIQRALAAERWVAGADVKLRIGLHAGEVHLRDGRNYVGAALNRCARLRDAAHGGQTVLSHSVHELVVDGLGDDLELIDLGEYRLEDLARSERVYQLCGADLPCDFPPLRSAAVPRDNLPTQLTSFVGRKDHLLAIEALIEQSRLVTLTGSAGCGKTRLALEVGANVHDRNPDGVWFVDLAPVATPNLVPHQVMGALGARQAFAGEVDVGELVVRTLGRQRMLLVLDNCEHLVGACAVFADTLLRRCPNVVLLATSREALNVAGEVAWRVPSMAVPEEGVEDPGAIGATEAVALFVERARLARPDFRLTQANAALVSEICRRLDGIPLALELAAARLRVLTAAQVRDGLEDRFALLVARSRSTIPRQQTLRSSIEWSVGLLSGLERALLQRLSVFAGSADGAAVAAVCAFGEIEPRHVLELMAGLVDKSLVLLDELSDGTARYRLLESIRQFGDERLETREHDTLVARHRRHYLALAEEAEPHLIGDAQEHWLARLDEALPNLRAALHSAVVGDARDDLARLSGALGLFWTQTGKLTEGARWLEQACAAAGPLASTARAKALWALAEISYSQGDIESAAARATEGLRVAQELSDDRWVARAHTHLGWTTSTMLDPGAEEHWNMAAVLADRTADRWSMQEVLGGRAFARLWDGQASAARELGAELLRVATDGGGRYHMTMALQLEAFSSLLLGDLERARAASEQVVARSRAFRDGFWLALGLSQAAWVLRYQGELDCARVLALECVDLSHEQGIRLFGESPSLSVLSEIELALGDHDAAMTAALQAVEIQREHGPFPGALPWHLACAAVAAAHRGAMAVAREYGAAAVEAASSSPVPSWQLGRAHLAAATVCLYDGDDDGADHHAGVAIVCQRACHDAIGTIDALEVVGEILVRRGALVDAARVAGAAGAHRAALGYARAPWELERAAGIDVALEGLDEAELEHALHEGASAPLDDTAAWVTRGRGGRRRTASGWAGLTPTELEVARHVAAGLSNPKIADRMYISRHTVESHLKHIYGKLSISSRAELAAEVVRRSGAAS